MSLNSKEKMAIKVGLGMVLTSGFGASVMAAEVAVQYDIPAGPLDESLRRFAQKAGIAVEMDAPTLSRLASPGLRGNFDIDAGLTRLLAGSGYAAERSASGYVIKPSAATKAMPVLKVKAGALEELPEAGGFRDRYQDSATKSQMSIRETPQSISVITRDSIEARQSLDLSSAVELAAGVVATGKAFAGNDPRTGESFVLRGQELDSARDIRIDGFTAGGDRNHFDLAPFERVEVIKGPSSMLYGQGSLGGFINMVRKKPQAETSLRAVAQAGSYDTYRGELDAAGALDPEELVLGQLTLAIEDSGSFIDSVETQRVVVAPSIEWLVGDRTRVLAQLIYQDDRFTPSLGIPLRHEGNELVPPNIPRSFFFGVPPTEKSTATAMHASFGVEHELSDRWLVTLMLHKTRNQLKGLSDSYGYGLSDAGHTYLYSSWVGHDNDNWAGEIRLNGAFDAFGREHRVLLGVERNRLEAHSFGGYSYVGTTNIYDGSLATAPSFPALSNPRSYDDFINGSNLGVYGQILFALTDRTKLLAGLRYDRAEQDRYGTFGGESTDNSEVTGRIGLTQDFGEHLTGYAVYAQSFNPVYAASRDGGALDPETGEGYELGLKGEWLDGKLGATAAVYRQELDNRAIPDPINRPNDYFISGGLERTEGLELEVTGSPLPGWIIGASGSWIDAEYIDRQDDNYGKTPGGTVERQASLYTHYELQTGSLKGLGFGVTLLSVGDRIVLTDENLIVKGYERMDVHVSYNGLPQWDLSLLIRNVADETYIERPNSAYLYDHFFGSPRAVLFRAEYNFR